MGRRERPPYKFGVGPRWLNTALAVPKLRKICSLSKKSSLPVKSRYFFTTNQLFCFRFDIDKVIRKTYTHTCMHTNIRIQRYTYIPAYMHEFIHKNNPPIITSTTDKGGNVIHSFIHSFNPDISVAPL